MELYPLIIAIAAATVTSSVAILLPGLGEGVSERAGILNIGAEGYMLMGALAAYFGYVASDNIWIGLLMGTLAGILFSLIHAFFSITLKADQVISGTGIWLLGLGLSSYIFRLLGIGTVTEKFDVIAVPLLKDIPFLGPVFFQQNILVYLSFFLVLVFEIVLHQTPWGLRNKGAGDSPLSTDMAGHNIALIRYVSTMVCGALAGLGGAYLAVGVLSRFSEGMVAGRGFIAIAVVIFGGWDPKKILVGALIFSLIDSIQMYLQATGSFIPFPFLLMMPYLLTIIIIVFASKKAQNLPRKLTIPYIRGEE